MPLSWTPASGLTPNRTEGTQEFITVFSGALTVLLDGERWGIADGDSIRFKADRKHAYANEGNTLCRLSMVICYPS